MADNTFISRTNLAGLIPEPVTREIIQGVTEGSAVLRMGRRLPNMSSKTQTLNVLDSLPAAYFVNGDTGTKKLTSMAWDKKKIYAEEIAVIVPIPEAVLDDSDYDIWGEVRPRIVEAFGKVIDGAILFGVNKPATWRKSIYDTCIENGAYVTKGSDVYSDIFGEGGTLAKVEECGFDANGIMASVNTKAMLRGLKDTVGHPLFKTSMQGTTTYDLEGIAMQFPMNGAFDSDVVNMIFGDFNQLTYAIRSDIEFKIFTEGVVQDPASGEILYNLMQNDMVALRAVMRLGWEIPNPISAFNADKANRCPFSLYVPNILNLALDVNISASTDLFGKYVTDLQDVALTGNTINGKSKWVTGYTGFSGDPAEQVGNFLAFHVSADTGSTLKFRLIGGKHTEWKTLDSDGIAVIQLGANKPYYEQHIEVRAEKDGKVVERSYYFTNITAEHA